MIVIEYNSIELDYCTDCQGVWFDSGELELLLKSMNLDRPNLLQDILATRASKTTEKKRKCPICRRKMMKTTVGRKPEILVDACGQGHGLWFDNGEICQLLEQQFPERPPAKTDSQQIVGFLKEVFKARK